MNIDALDDLLDFATAVGALESGQKEEDVLHRLNGDGAALALAAQQIDDYKQRDSGRAWTTEEDRFLEEALGQLSTDEIASYLGRTPTAIKVRWTRKGYAAPSKQPGELTANGVAEALGVDVHAVCDWIDQDILPGRRLPMETNVRVVKQITLYRWAINPMNWIYFENSVYEDARIDNGRGAERGPSRMGDQHLARLIELKKKRWGDRWWSTAQVGEYHGVDHTTVNNAVHRGEFETAVKWQNWRILRSEAVQHRFFHGKGHSKDEWSPNADAFMVLAEAIGLGPTITAALMGPAWKNTRVTYRLHCLFERGRIGEVLNWLNGGLDEGYVYCDVDRRLLWTDWRYYTYRFPMLSRATERFVRGDELTYDERQYVRGVMRSWLCWKQWPKDGNKQQQTLMRKMKYGRNAVMDTLHEWRRQLAAWGIHPFGDRHE